MLSKRKEEARKEVADQTRDRVEGRAASLRHQTPLAVVDPSADEDPTSVTNARWSAWYSSTSLACTLPAALWIIGNK